MAFVVKVKFENTLRRLTIETRKDGSLGLSFIDLVAKIHDLFHISPDERLVLTYVDEDNDLVTMGGDHDLHDAWIVQKINPLRIHVNIGNTMIREPEEALNKFISPNAITEPHEHAVIGSSRHLATHQGKGAKSVMDNWCSKKITPDKVQNAVHAYRPSIQIASKLCTLDNVSQRVLQTSYRREDFSFHCSHYINGKARKNDPSLQGWKNHRSHYIDGKVGKNDPSLHGWHRRMRRSPGGGSISGKLDARFVCDVTIFDGTELVCGTHFTKIWRLRNIGTCSWPPETLLIYTGGDLSGERQSALVEVPEEGLPCEEEMNVAVDFVAPESPGRYVSHWRLQAPSGQKFGQRIWVLIKVVSECMDIGVPHTIKETQLNQEPVDRDLNNDILGIDKFLSKDPGKSWAHQ